MSSDMGEIKNLKTGLLGQTLSHSMSPFLHTQMGDTNYRLFEVEPQNLGEFMASDIWDAINVTIPYKVEVIKYCTSLTEAAREIGAVNSIVKRNGEIIGDNTDYAGFCDNVRGISFSGKKVVILGTGGASLTVRKCAEMLGAETVLHISRKPENNKHEGVNVVGYEETEKYIDADILVNATPIGMYPNNDEVPIPLNIFRKLSAVVDLIYNPLRTRLILEAKRLGITAVGGVRMLCTQAREARVFFGDTPTISPFDIERRLIRSMENIVFVGMPGCGKSTFARIISERFHKQFIDTDIEIVKSEGMSIPELFNRFGETGFRECEKKQIRRVSMQKGAVIATGGGSVLDTENRMMLKQNSFVIWLDCPKEKLATSGRPLSSSPEAISEMSKKRPPIYESIADAKVTIVDDNSRNVGQIIAILEKHSKGEI